MRKKGHVGLVVLKVNWKLISMAKLLVTAKVLVSSFQQVSSRKHKARSITPSVQLFWLKMYELLETQEVLFCCRVVKINLWFSS